MGVQKDDNDESTTVVDDAEEKKTKTCCKRVFKALFSHVGLGLMVIAYTCIGAYIFQHLEQTNEKQECIEARKKYVKEENSTNDKLWLITNSYPTDEAGAQNNYKQVLKSFRDNVLDLNYGGVNCEGIGGKIPSIWSYGNALIFSATIITTVGYGHIAPKTNWGRLVCIAYALLGIPLMLMFLANIGEVLADLFRFIYTRFCCCGCCRRRLEKKVKPEQNDRGSPDAWKDQYNNKVVDDDEDDEDEEEEDYHTFSVPVTITMLVIVLYVVIGALIFDQWETDWDLRAGGYFCFVTISTIGFGDLVPGAKHYDPGKMIFLCMYMLIGMALLSMCLSLIQEEIVAKFRWIGEKLGILEKDKTDDDDDEEEESDDEQEQASAQTKPKANSTSVSSTGSEEKRRLASYYGVNHQFPPQNRLMSPNIPCKPGMPPVAHRYPMEYK